MIIKPKAIELVWEDEGYGVIASNLKGIRLSMVLKNDEIYFFINRIFSCEFESVEQAKSYAQQWANDLVASIAKPFVVPDDSLKLGRQYTAVSDTFNDGYMYHANETLRLNGISNLF